MSAKTLERTRNRGSIRAEGDSLITCQQTNLENGVRIPEWELMRGRNAPLFVGGAKGLCLPVTPGHLWRVSLL